MFQNNHPLSVVSTWLKSKLKPVAAQPTAKPGSVHHFGPQLTVRIVRLQREAQRMNKR